MEYRIDFKIKKRGYTTRIIARKRPFFKGGTAGTEQEFAMTATTSRTSAYRRRHRRSGLRTCVCCGAQVPFTWACRCGFDICQACMEENLWGMSCNAITWFCPDCGRQNGFGNQ